jgi:phospholipid/cholesterol/gamma-HCH transport system substrate-binding protein
VSKEVKVALFAIIIIVVFVLGLNYLKGKGFLDNNTTYYAVFDNLNGLKVSNPVLVNGFQVGTVSKLSFMYNGPYAGKIVGRLTVTNDVKIPKESTAILYSSGLMGDMSIKLIFSDEKNYHEFEDTINTKIEGDLLTELGGELTPITEKINVLMDNINTLFDFEKKNTQSLNYTIESINKTLEKFQTMGDVINENLASQLNSIDSILKNLQRTTATLNANEDNLTTLVSNLTEFSETLNSDEFQTMLTSLSSTSEGADELMKKLNSSDNTVGALLNEKELYNEAMGKIESLDGVIENVNLLLEDMKANPGRYIHFSVFGKKDKK